MHVRMHVRMLKRKLKNTPRKLRPVRRCFLSFFTLITCRSLVILNFIYARKARRMQVRKLCKNLSNSGNPPLSAYFLTLNSKICNIRSFHISVYWKNQWWHSKKERNISVRAVTCAQDQWQKHYTNLNHLLQQSIAHKILKEKYKKMSVLLQQFTFEIIYKIYFLQEPKKSASAVALLQNKL